MAKCHVCKKGGAKTGPEHPKLKKCKDCRKAYEGNHKGRTTWPVKKK